MIKITKAVKSLRPLKLCLSAPSGAGKTFTALSIASGLGSKILLLDSENKSSMLYADRFNFDVVELDPHDPTPLKTFQDVLDEALKLDYDVLIIDSLSIYWNATLEKKSKIDMAGGDSFRNWGKITPEWNQLLASIVSYPKHMLCTLREKTDYVMEQNDKGKIAPRKVGLAPIFREGAEYEFDIFGKLDLDHNLLIEKTRLSFLADQVISNPDQKLGEKIKEFLSSGAVVPEAPKAPELHVYNFSANPKAIEWAKSKNYKEVCAGHYAFELSDNEKLKPYLVSTESEYLANLEKAKNLDFEDVKEIAEAEAEAVKN